MTLALVTNDDGIDSPGLDMLAQVAVDAGFEVMVVAPMHDCSGMSAAVSGNESDVRVAVARDDSSRLPGLAGLVLNGTPGLIAWVAMHGAFGRVPDVVLSGINLGGNYGSDVIHSGTVGAALTGAMCGARSLAVSLNVKHVEDTALWNVCTPYIERVLPWLLDSKPGTTLSLNVPNSMHVRGLRQAHLAAFSLVEPIARHADTRRDGEGRRPHGVASATAAASSTADNAQQAEAEAQSDDSLLRHGYATITQLVAAHEVIGSDLSALNTDLTTGSGRIGR